MELEKDEITLFIQDNWADQFNYPLVFHEVISNHGSDNIIFSTANGKLYVFRIIFSHPDAVHNGSQIYEYLYNKGIPVPLPIKTDSDEYMVDAWDEENKRMISYSIHTFVEGEEKIDKNDLLPLLDSMAEWLGKLHQVLSDLDFADLDLQGLTSHDVVQQKVRIDVGFSDVLTKHQPEHPFVIEMFSFWKNWKASLDLSTLSTGLIHGDIGPGCNILVKDNEVSAFIDLIDVGYGYYMQDVASFVMYGGLYKEEHQDWLDHFKTNYITHSQVTKEEFSLLSFFLLWRFLIQALYFSWRLDIDYTQGNTEDEDNQKGFDDALWFLNYWKQQYGSIMDD